MARKLNASAALDHILDELMNDSADYYNESTDMSDEPEDDEDLVVVDDDTTTEDIEDELDGFDDMDDDDDDDTDLGDLDSELDALAGDLDDADMDALKDELETDSFVTPEDRAGVQLTPSEEIQADDMMQTAGTACLIKSEMDECGKQQLLESASDLRAALVEGFLTESMIEDLKIETEAMDLDAYNMSEEEFTEAKIAQKTKVVFNKQARMKQLFSIAVNVSARAHNDPMYTKYAKASKLKRMYREKLQVKYRNEATKRMKVMFARLKRSKSPILKKLGDKAQSDNK